MGKDKDFFNENEKKCWEKLQVFNDNVLHIKDLGRTPTKHWTDASGHTADSRYINMELKNRNQIIYVDDNSNYIASGSTDKGNSYTADSLYIEQHKVCSMMLDWVCLGYEPIYINFLNDCIVVYNLSKLKRRPITEPKKIHSKGYGKMEIGTREGLFLTDATIYDYNYNLIKRPQ